MGATLTIPDLDEAFARRLRAQADSHGRSMEAEAREILVRAVSRTEEPPVDAAPTPQRQSFLGLAGSVEGSPDLSRKRGFEA